MISSKIAFNKGGAIKNAKFTTEKSVTDSRCISVNSLFSFKLVQIDGAGVNYTAQV